jgi:hypothetical protein
LTSWAVKTNREPAWVVTGPTGGKISPVWSETQPDHNPTMSNSGRMKIRVIVFPIQHGTDSRPEKDPVSRMILNIY